MNATRYLRSFATLTVSAALLLGAALARADGMTTEQAQEMLNELKAIRAAVEKMQAPQQAAPAPDDKVSYKLSPGGFSMGDAKAPLVMVEYTDFQCPFCQQFHNTAFAQIKANAFFRSTFTTTRGAPRRPAAAPPSRASSGKCATP